MTANYLELSAFQVGVAAALIVVNGLISVALRLNLERSLLLASVRTVVQLTLIGYVLRAVFALHSLWVVLALMACMTAIAGVAAVRRTTHRYPGVWWNSVVSVWCSSWLVTGLALTVIVDVEPWHLPQYSIPLLGMILGNTLNGISLGLDRLSKELLSSRHEVESLLCMGATRWEAARGPIREAVRTGMIPIINSMSVVGIVSLPGMMTGQLLAGVEPVQAVKYQIVIMFMIASGAALGTVGVVMLGYRTLFSSQHQFLYRIVERIDGKS